MLFSTWPFELRHAASMHSLLVPPLHFERELHLFNQGLHHSGAKTDVFHLLINSPAAPETQWLNVAGS